MYYNYCIFFRISIIEFAAVAVSEEMAEKGWSFNGIRDENEADDSDDAQSIGIDGSVLEALLQSKGKECKKF